MKSFFKKIAFAGILSLYFIPLFSHAEEKFCFVNLSGGDECSTGPHASDFCSIARDKYIRDKAAVAKVFPREIEALVYICQPKSTSEPDEKHTSWCYNSASGGIKCVGDKKICEDDAEKDNNTRFCFEGGTPDSGDKTDNGLGTVLIDPNKPSNPTATQIKEGNAVYGDRETDPTKSTWTSIVWGCNGGKIGEGGCTFNDAINQVQKLINYAFFMVIVILPLLIVYAGYLYVSASWEGDKNLSKAKEIFKNTVIAYIVAAAAWAIVHFILKALVTSEFINEANKFIQ